MLCILPQYFLSDKKGDTEVSPFDLNYLSLIEVLFYGLNDVLSGKSELLEKINRWT